VPRHRDVASASELSTAVERPRRGVTRCPIRVLHKKRTGTPDDFGIGLLSDLPSVERIRLAASQGEK
jgi:hypothetical protein